MLAGIPEVIRFRYPPQTRYMIIRLPSISLSSTFELGLLILLEVWISLMWAHCTSRVTFYDLRGNQNKSKPTKPTNKQTSKQANNNPPTHRRRRRRHHHNHHHHHHQQRRRRQQTNKQTRKKHKKDQLTNKPAAPANRSTFD